MTATGQTAGSAPRRMEEWNGVRVLVIGLARSGQAAARLLLRHGARVSGCDQRPASALPGVSELSQLGVELHLGSDQAGALTDADVVVVSPGVPPTALPLAEADRRGVPSVSEVEVAFQASRAPWVAITGTNGKSTTTALTGELLRRAGRRPWVAGNIGNALSEGIEEVAEDGIVVAETSSFQLERTITFRPHVAVLLNLSPDHLDRYAGYDDYVEAKARMFLYQRESDFAILNADDSAVAHLAARCDARVRTFSRRGSVVAGTYADAGSLWSVHKGETVAITECHEIRLPGPHNLENALAALAVCQVLGAIDDDSSRTAVAEGLREFPGLEHRLEFCGEVAGRRFYNDSKATNVESLRQALLSLPRPLTLIAGGRDKHGDFLSLAELAEQRIEHLVLIGESARVIAAAWPHVSQECAEDIESALERAYRATPEGGVIALSPGCASYDMFRDYEERGRRFKTLVQALIRRHGSGGDR